LVPGPCVGMEFFVLTVYPDNSASLSIERSSYFCSSLGGCSEWWQHATLLGIP
jgi:hypothetical protein